MPPPGLPAHPRRRPGSLGPRGLGAVLALAALGGCGGNAENPFAPAARTDTPRPGAQILFVSNLHGPTDALRELYAGESSGAGLTRLTFCNSARPTCDNLEAAAARDRRRFAIRRVVRDGNGNGRLDGADPSALVVADLATGLEVPAVTDPGGVSGIDFSRSEELLLFSAPGPAGPEDLWTSLPNGTSRTNVTSSTTISERRPRFDPSGRTAVYERREGSGKSGIYILPVQRLTSGGPGEGTLPDGSYALGSDADPTFSPDGRSVVFRRLTAAGPDGRGQWDILVVRADGLAVTAVATGAAFRGAPDWGPLGIVFAEADTAGARLVVAQADGTGRRAAVSTGPGFDLSSPRWLP
jgi:Tol biopolymer transport system component